MIPVSNDTKIAWGMESSSKIIEITVGNTTIGINKILGESYSITESIISSSSLEFVGCIAKKCEFVTSAFNNINLKGRKVSVRVKAGNTEWINVFTGYIDEAKKDGMRGLKRVTAYDIFYKLSQIDVSDWWNGLGSTNVIGTFINFINTYHLDYNSSAISFVNSTMNCKCGISKQIKKLTGTQYLMQLCQINGCIGYTDGFGRFGIKYIDALAQQALYPSMSLFPSDYIYPSNYTGGSVGDVTNIPYYQNLEYEDYSIKQIDKVTIRHTSEDLGVSYPYSGENNYIIQGNIFVIDLSASEKLECAEKIYSVVKNANFRPFTGKHPTFPWLECGDKISYYDIDDNGNTVEVNFIIMSRHMSGDQMMWDTFSAEGEQDQRIFITDLQAQIEDLQNQIDDMSGDTPNGSLYGMVVVEYTQPIETPTLGGIEEAISGIATEIT